MAIYIDDRELVAAHRAGDGDAFDELVREHRRALLSHAKRKLHCDASAEDALQETLVRAYRALPNFSGEYRLGPWLHRIMHNVCIDESVRRHRDGEKTDQFASQPSARRDVPSVEEELGLQFDDLELNSALAELPVAHREALVLRFVDELNYDEVAQVAGVSEQNARARVSRARQAMRVAMKGVAALPVLLLGLARRGEKAAAAAVTSTTGAASASVHSVTTGAAAVATPAPALAEAAVAITQAAPAAVPVIAKAAVGIGLAAAVLTPTSDSAVHQAFENLTTSSAGVVVEMSTDEESTSAVAAAADASTDGSDNEITMDAYSPIETVSPSIEQSATSSQNNQAPAAIAERPDLTGAGGSIDMRSIEIRPIGGDRYNLTGPAQLNIESNSYAGMLTTSWLRLDAETDADDRRRVDGLLDLKLDTGTSVLIRIAGFADGSLNELRVAGLFRADTNALGLTEAGSFNGSIAMGSPAGAVALTLIP
ncbi:MAG TPA: hypothetical protein DGO43_00305 [Chloroflexi bacterium]|nr:hypothetical protein [Chloroflexota bacterium]